MCGSCTGGYQIAYPMAPCVQDCAGQWGYPETSTFKILDACGNCKLPIGYDSDGVFDDQTYVSGVHGCCPGEITCDDSTGSWICKCLDGWVPSIDGGNGLECPGNHSCVPFAGGSMGGDSSDFDCHCACDGEGVIDECGMCDGDAYGNPAVPGPNGEKCTDLDWVTANSACVNMDCAGHCTQLTELGCCGTYCENDCWGSGQYGGATFNPCGFCTGGESGLPIQDPVNTSYLYGKDCSDWCDGNPATTSDNSLDECGVCACSGCPGACGTCGGNTHVP